MKTVILSADDLRFIVNKIGLDNLMDQAINRLTDAFLKFDASATVIPVRGGFKYSHPHLGLVEWMPGMRASEGVYIKVVGYHPESAALNGFPTILSTQSVYSVEDGHLISLMDASFSTAVRTGAASAIASKALAKAEASEIGLIGCGAQAVTQLHALSRLFPVQNVYLYDTNEQAMNSFADRIGNLGLAHIKIESGPVSDWVHKVDILVTATSVGIGDGPVFCDNSLQKHIHINAVGSDFPGKFEVPKSILERALVCPDFTEQAAAEGECQHMMPEDIGPNISEVLKNQENYQAARESITVFDSTGWALEDIVMMDMFREYALELKMGRAVQLETVSQDPLNPYKFLNETEASGEFSLNRNNTEG